MCVSSPFKYTLPSNPPVLWMTGMPNSAFVGVDLPARSLQGAHGSHLFHRKGNALKYRVFPVLLTNVFHLKNIFCVHEKPLSLR